MICFCFVLMFSMPCTASRSAGRMLVPPAGCIMPIAFVMLSRFSSAFCIGTVQSAILAVGSGADTALLQRLAEAGGGRYYFTNEFTDLPEIFAKETLAFIAAKREGILSPADNKPAARCADIAFQYCQKAGIRNMKLPCALIPM